MLGAFCDVENSWLCSGCGSYLPVCHCGGHASPRDVLVNRIALGQIFLQVLPFSPVSVIAETHALN
jgi:hypothetical protein